MTSVIPQDIPMFLLVNSSNYDASIIRAILLGHCGIHTNNDANHIWNLRYMMIFKDISIPQAPYIAAISSTQYNFDTVLMVIHTDPNEVTEEINALDNVLTYLSPFIQKKIAL
ncbi:hypothetical protein [Methanococcoides burtonii]|uniref:hypothetical protein n=1 Tax=Methanococcoides burtonii TaxID=29291 RepID=UPI0012F633A1|nr:hypothetical protein [Methanococcoides burtonii]